MFQQSSLQIPSSRGFEQGFGMQFRMFRLTFEAFLLRSVFFCDIRDAQVWS